MYDERCYAILLLLKYIENVFKLYGRYNLFVYYIIVVIEIK